MGVLALSALVCGACSVLAWSYVWKVSRLLSVEARSLVDDGRELALAPRLVVFAAAAPPGSWEADLAAALREASSAQDRLVVARECLDTLEYALTSRSLWPLVAGRLCVAAGAFMLIGGLLAGGRLELLWLLPLVAITRLGCEAARRRGARQARQQRVLIDALMEAVLGDLVHLELPEPRRRRTRGVRR